MAPATVSVDECGMKSLVGGIDPLRVGSPTGKAPREDETRVRRPAPNDIESLLRGIGMVKRQNYKPSLFPMRDWAFL